MREKTSFGSVNNMVTKSGFIKSGLLRTCCECILVVVMGFLGMAHCLIL